MRVLMHTHVRADETLSLKSNQQLWHHDLYTRLKSGEVAHPMLSIVHFTIVIINYIHMLNASNTVQSTIHRKDG